MHAVEKWQTDELGQTLYVAVNNDIYLQQRLQYISKL